MYVLERKDGKFQAVQTYKDPLSEKTRKVTVTIDKNTSRQRNLAARILQEKISKAIEGAGLARTRMTFGSLVERYLESIKGTHKASTVARNTFALHTWLTLIGKDTLKFDRLLTEKGFAYELLNFPKGRERKLVHVFSVMYPMYPESREVFTKMDAFFKEA